jgi:hypothetical protein
MLAYAHVTEGCGETWRALIFGGVVLKNYKMQVRPFEQSELTARVLLCFL